MSFIRMFFFALITLGTHLYGNSCENMTQANGGKCYINQESIIFDENKIWVNFGSDWKEVQALRSDERGLYLAAEDLPLGFWQCGRCNLMNPPWNFVCFHCKSPRGA